MAQATPLHHYQLLLLLLLWEPGEAAAMQSPPTQLALGVEGQGLELASHLWLHMALSACLIRQPLLAQLVLVVEVVWRVEGVLVRVVGAAVYRQGLGLWR
jgi:hypothetical protein